ncbi:flagellar assembly protein FliH [Dickeya undicola]|uniref:Flagellar assembly protein FliH n=1 Tax=Dickeya undicola TaxID=1577887 RepID=A0ABX9X0X0_9GAMM|nr:flagellar assembly protein FliH [Dickeya undicola]RNM27127.1 flagellar assembly protein FliH [Dickeya undicola]
MSNSSSDLDWQPWKLDDLSAPRPAAADLVAPISSSPISPAVQPGDNDFFGMSDFQPPEDDLATLREQVLQQARESGFAEGKQQGYAAGYQDGLQTGTQQGLQDAAQQQQPVIAQMQQMVNEFQQTLDALDSVIVARLMQLALTAAKQVIGQSPVCDGTALMGQIQQLIQQEPMFSGKPQLRVHPSDLERVEQHLGPTLSLHGWRLLADNQLHPGGCKVSAEEGDLDSSIATRWHELCRLAAPGEL